MCSQELTGRIADALDAPSATSFRLRWEKYSPELVASLRALYGGAAAALERRLFDLMLTAAAARPADLRELDEARLLSPDWLQQPDMVGYVAYADRFAGDLRRVGDHIDYLKSLGITYLHLMPLLLPRPGENDGGYAVADFRTVRPDLGTMADLESLATRLRRESISLEVDLVLNHVAREHEWAQRARAGEDAYRNYFLMFPDRTLPDEYEKTLPEVFPDFAPGNFTWDDEANAYVWTTFNSYQWDLNWANPDVFAEFADIILFLANKGVDVFRLDAIAFLGKVMGTSCQNQPQVHHITRALRAVSRIVAPAVAFKAEAIVNPQDLSYYLGRGEFSGKLSDLAYHNTLMVQAWSALATRDVRLFGVALSKVPRKPTSTTWATYVRCHDDIGWAVSDEDAADLLIDGSNHRRFLSDFYSGRFPGSFAKGLIFQDNPATGERRISGTLASLAGLEVAVQSRERFRVLDAVHRIELLHAVVLGFGGLPLIYMGDEIALLNDYRYTEEPDHAADNRWVHRPVMNWSAVAALDVDPDSPSAWVHAGIQHLIEVRKRTPHLDAAVESQVLATPDQRVLMLLRDHPLGAMVQLYNFSEDVCEFPSDALRSYLGGRAVELIGGYDYDLTPPSIRIDKYQALWLIAA